MMIDQFIAHIKAIRFEDSSIGSSDGGTCTSFISGLHLGDILRLGREGGGGITLHNVAESSNNFCSNVLGTDDTLTESTSALYRVLQPDKAHRERLLDRLAH